MRNETQMFAAGALLAACTSFGAFAQGGATCASAAVAITGANAYNNAGATEDLDYAGLCDMGQFGTDTNFNVKWFKWTAPTTDTYTVSTCNTAGGVDTRLSAQTGCAAATVVACNDDGVGCAGFSSIMTLSATSGVQYYLCVGVYSATSVGGAGTMTISVGGGGGGGGSGDCCVANPGTTCCSDQSCCDTVCASDAYCCQTEWDQICADEAATLCPACGAGGCTIPGAAVTEQEACGDDTNGGCNGGGANQSLPSLNTSVGGTFWASTTTRDTDWYGFTIAAGTQITLNLYSNLPSFCAIVDNPGCTIIGAVSSGTCPSTLTACIGPGNYYLVALPSQFIELPCGGALGNNYTLQISSVSCSFTPPPGDNCSAPIVGHLGANPFTNVNAGTSYGEVTCGFGGAAFTKDVFFRFVAPATDAFTFQTCDSSAPFDTGIEIWDGCPDAGGNQLACNDDGPGCVNFSSIVSADLQSGTAYIVRVGGWQGATGTTELNISQGAPTGPENDDCANATVATVGSTPFDTAGSTTDGPNPTDPICGAFGSSFFNDVWFSFTAPATSNYLVSLCSATWDTRLDIYTACGGTIVVCNDDSCGLASEVTLAATAGTTYKIRIGGYGAANFGVGTMAISDTGGGGGGGGAGLTCATAVTLAMGPTAFNRAGATVDLDYTGLCDMGPFGTEINYNAIFYKFSPTQSGNYTFSTCNAANHDTRLSAQTSCEVSSVVACNDDATGCSGYSSIMTATLSCGIQYIIAVGGYSATTPLGTGTLTVSVASPVNCGVPCPGDLNNDHVRNGLDLTVILSNWGSAGGDCNGDGTTNGLDLTVLLSGWGPCP